MEKIEVKSVTKVAFNDERILLLAKGFEINLRLLDPEKHGKIKVGDDFIQQLMSILSDSDSSFSESFLGAYTNAADEKVIELEKEIVSQENEITSLKSTRSYLNDSVATLQEDLKSLQSANAELTGQLSSRDGFIASVEKENNELREKISDLSAAAEKKRSGK